MNDCSLQTDDDNALASSGGSSRFLSVVAFAIVVVAVLIAARRRTDLDCAIRASDSATATTTTTNGTNRPRWLKTARFRVSVATRRRCYESRRALCVEFAVCAAPIAAGEERTCRTGLCNRRSHRASRSRAAFADFQFTLCAFVSQLRMFLERVSSPSVRNNGARSSAHRFGRFFILIRVVGRFLCFLAKLVQSVVRVLPFLT